MMRIFQRLKMPMNELSKHKANKSNAHVACIIIILGIMIIISGCNNSSGIGGGKGSGGSISGSKDFYKGTSALSINFVKDMPPAEVYDKNSDFVIGLELKNEGAENVSEGVMTVSVERDYIELKGILQQRNSLVSYENIEGKPNALKFNLGGKSILLPSGEKGIIYFNAAARELAEESQALTSKISVNSCYKYKTVASPSVCVDADYTNTNPFQKSCVVSDVSIDSQGAPVAVTKIESEMVPSTDDTSIIKPRFIITVKNLGNGEVIREDKVEGACSSERLGQGEWNNIKVKAYISTMTDEKNKLDCNIIGGDKYDNGTLILKQKEDSIRCSYEEGFKQIKGTFSSPLYIILDYGYTDTISKDVKIRKVVTN